MSGPVLGSLIGNYLVLAGWQWTFRFMTILVGINTVAVIMFMDETYAPYVLFLSDDDGETDVGIQGCETTV